MIKAHDIYAAFDRISNMINHTPIMTSGILNNLSGKKLFFKCENFQKVGAFKYRGACNAILQNIEKAREFGVMTHSSGNHAQAIAKASQELGIKATIIMPRNAPQVKIDATRNSYGAKVVFCENTVESREKTATKLTKQNNYIFIHPYDNEFIIAGAGTAALELLKFKSNFDALIIPVGGGGLLSGSSIITKHLNSDIKIFAAEPENADDAYRSLHADKIIKNTTTDTIADGLRTNLSPLTFGIIKKNTDQVFRISEKDIIEAMRLIWERMKIIVEPSAAITLSAVLHKEFPDEIKNIGLILSGGNIDLSSFFDIS
ncbi:MAG: pyridoxal-phosphate dependent enzyme [Candidatus Zixiibacteriota bacterium]